MGTLLTDILTDVVELPLWVSTVGFAALLAGTFSVWFAREGTLSIHSIVTRRREIFYWLAILFTFALGTAVGDLLSEALGIGYLLASILFAAVSAAVAVAYFVFHADAVFCFWTAYVLTRPLGASLGDLSSQPVADGGLGLGSTATTVVFASLIVGLIVFLTLQLGRRRAGLASTEAETDSDTHSDSHSGTSSETDSTSEQRGLGTARH